MENFAIGIASSIVGGIILILLGKWKGWWWKSKSPEAVELATRVLKVLDGNVDEKINNLVNITLKLGNEIVLFYKNKTPFNSDLETQVYALIQEILEQVKPLATELSAAGEELDHLKQVINSFIKELQIRASTIKHLSHPPNLPAMDPGHVREQLLTKNLLPQELLKASKGEVAIFLRGYGLNWFERNRYLQNIKKKHAVIYNESVNKEYRTVLQTTALHKSKK